ncbi:MAG: RagB/SusD family nutrient uptake outer membrane protein [Bacteroidales bacterium]|nr:RagB/SusD family nutrient uptake outer membrane protein [Bacteroidales bacterium]
MKKIYTFICLLALCSLSSCSLKENTSSISVPGDFFRKYSECQSVVNGCYIPLKSIYTYTYMIATECVTDHAFIASGTLDCRLDISPAIPRYGSTVWTQGYLGVQRCNFAVQGIENSTAINETQRAELLCEAKVLRAFYFYTLTCFFGDVPFYFDDVSDNAALERISMLPRMSADSTRKACIEDLKGIVDKVPQTRTSDNAGARLGASAGWMLIAKMAMWNKDYEEALSALSHLEEIYGEDLSVYDYAFNASFRNHNTPESIMEVQHNYVEGGMNYTSNVACICTPSCTMIYDESGNVVDATFDGVSIPELGHECTVWSAMRPCMMFSQGLQPKQGKDIRKDVNMAWEYNGQKFINGSERPWPGPKFWCPYMKVSSDSNNYKVFRYADAVLLQAEAWFYLGDTEKSLHYLNKTRNRAGIGDYIFRTDVRLEEEIRNERSRELWGEFQRKFDLVRWGIWFDKVQDASDYMTLKENALPCHRYYPIPDKEVVYSKYHLDNNEYKKYGL